MASAFDEAEQRRISSSGTKPPTFNPISSTTGKTIPGGSTAVLVERLNRSLAEFRKEVMKSAGHESKKNATILRKQEMMVTIQTNFPTFTYACLKVFVGLNCDVLHYSKC